MAVNYVGKITSSTNGEVSISYGDGSFLTLDGYVKNIIYEILPTSSTTVNYWKMPFITTSTTTTTTDLSFHYYDYSWPTTKYEMPIYYTITLPGLYKFSHQEQDLPTRLKKVIESRVSPRIKTSRNSLKSSNDIREQRARETLKRVLGEQKYKNFVRNGFISVKAKSGLVYQIYPGYNKTSVYKNGQKIESLCVILNGNFPPTDSLIMRYLLLLNNEEMFRSKAIKHSVNNYDKFPQQEDNRDLNEIYRSLKAG